MALLPPDVKHVHLRSDSAGYQEDLIRYCAEGSDPRFGVIPSLDDKHWHPIYQEDADGNKIKTNQEWADICFVPDWAVRSNQTIKN